MKKTDQWGGKPASLPTQMPQKNLKRGGQKEMKRIEQYSTNCQGQETQSIMDAGTRGGGRKTRKEIILKVLKKGETGRVRGSLSRRRKLDIHGAGGRVSGTRVGGPDEGPLKKENGNLNCGRTTRLTWKKQTAQTIFGPS